MNMNGQWVVEPLFSVFQDDLVEVTCSAIRRRLVLDDGASGNYPPSRSYQIHLPDQTGLPESVFQTPQCPQVSAQLTESLRAVSETLRQTRLDGGLDSRLPERFRYGDLN
jgi:hypothetical protein